MRIFLVTPAPPDSRAGNRVTALRWARILRGLGHEVHVGDQYDGQSTDVLLALHARKSARAMRRFRALYPDSPVILALTGTDLYHDLETSRAAQESLEHAWRLVLLQLHGLSRLPSRLAHKARVIYQSAESLRHPPRPRVRTFDICVVGHLRPVKDPLRTALAARRLPEESRIRILHLGKALQPALELRARREMESNPRYHWLGEKPRGETRQYLARSRLLVHTSKSEGGPNVFSEALAAGVPILSSHISGAIGILGPDYPGFFQVGETQGLTDLMHRAEKDSAYYQKLKRFCAQRADLVDPQREQTGWRELLGEIFWEACSDGGQRAKDSRTKRKKR